MLKKLKGPLTAAMVSSLALVPAATVAYMATADVAIAKSDKAGGNGKGNGSQKSSKSQTASSKGKSATKSASARGGGSKSRGGGSLGKLFDRITGQDKAKTAKTRAKTSTSSAKLAAAEPKARRKDDPMHPSNLGKMNGPLNANINAVLAHIRNGNTNGPIGALSALAVAGANADGAQDVLDLKQDFMDLQTALDGSPYESVEDYLAALEGEEPIEPIPAIEDALTALGDAQQTEDNLVGALEDAGYFGETALADYQQDVADEVIDPILNVDTALGNYTDPAGAQADLDAALASNSYGGEGYEGADPLGDYLADKEGTPPAEPDLALNDAIGVLGGDATGGVAPTAIEPTDDEVADAETDIQAQTDAELAMLEHWNKNPDTDPTMISEEEQAVLDKLYEKLAPYSEDISALLPEEEIAEEEFEEVADVTECLPEGAECSADEEVAAAE